MRRSLIVAMTADRVIGREGDLPWRLRSDLQRFKRLTMGHHLIMGRTTYESIGRPLPGRTSLVLSRDADYRIDHESVQVLGSLEQAFQVAEQAGDQEAFVIGGGQIYQQALPHVDRMYMTHVEAPVSGDAYFPEWNTTEWELLSEEKLAADEQNEYRSVFRLYERR
jgi:dihydrofolate reductase